MNPYKLDCDLATLNRLASNIVQEHAGLIAQGYVLTRSSGYWLTRRGDATARFVYRRKSDSCTFTLRRLRVVWA